MTGIRPKTLDWQLWFYWIMATTLGWLAGSIFFQGIPVVISGVAIAAFQWAAISRYIPKAWRWLLVSSSGWILGYILFLVFLSSNFGFLLGPVLGGVVGFSQWFLLRQEVELAGWWIVISILAWTTGLTLIPGLFSSGALPGALTGLTLVILFRFSSKS